MEIRIPLFSVGVRVKIRDDAYEHFWSSSQSRRWRSTVLFSPLIIRHLGAGLITVALPVVIYDQGWCFQSLSGVYRMLRHQALVLGIQSQIRPNLALEVHRCSRLSVMLWILGYWRQTKAAGDCLEWERLLSDCEVLGSPRV